MHKGTNVPDAWRCALVEGERAHREREKTCRTTANDEDARDLTVEQTRVVCGLACLSVLEENPNKSGTVFDTFSSNAE